MKGTKSEYKPQGHESDENVKHNQQHQEVPGHCWILPLKQVTNFFKKVANQFDPQKSEPCPFLSVLYRV